MATRCGIFSVAGCAKPDRVVYTQILTMNPSDKLENFERAFRNGTAGCVRTCECGVTYYDTVGRYDWEPEEFEGLKTNKKAVPLDYTPGDIHFEGRRYVDGCNCWHERAKKIMGFIDGHAHQIAKYLTLEKQRKQSIADNAPEVEP